MIQTLQNISFVVLIAFVSLFYFYMAAYMIISGVLAAWQNHISKQISKSKSK